MDGSYIHDTFSKSVSVYLKHVSPHRKLTKATVFVGMSEIRKQISTQRSVSCLRPDSRTRRQTWTGAAQEWPPARSWPAMLRDPSIAAVPPEDPGPFCGEPNTRQGQGSGVRGVQFPHLTSRRALPHLRYVSPPRHDEEER